MFFPLLKNKSLSRYIAALIVLLILVGTVSAQEALKSAEEDYYDFLSLQGLAHRPTLNYRTLSDGNWQLEGAAKEGNHVWAANNLGTTFTLWQDSTPAENWFANGLLQGITMKVYGPDWYNSFNTAAPYGQNDGALWQGKGYNTSLTAGLRLEGYGFELTFKPQLSFSQNMSFDIMPSNTDSPYGYFWGYGKNVGIDAPQRFGDKPFFVYDWGDSEVRWSWHSFTVGFGTQSIWLGPAFMNPILHSNNAASYPKVDIGLRRQKVVLPWLNWYLGDIEARIWTGKLTESDYFDNDDSNNHNMIHGLTFAYAPSFVPGLTLFANRVCLVKWDWANLKYLWPKEENTHVGEKGAGEDQKMSLGFDWIFPQVGFEVYGEVGRDDYSSLKVYPLRTIVYTVGLKKTFSIYEKWGIYGQLNFEINNNELSHDFYFQWPYSFYYHYQITQGYTNRGQLLANSFSPAGNSQIVNFSVYYPKGKTILSFKRTNPDNNYVYKYSIGTENTPDITDVNGAYKTYISFGISSWYYISSALSIYGGFEYVDFHHYFYWKDSPIKGNVYLSLGAKYNL